MLPAVERASPCTRGWGATTFFGWAAARFGVPPVGRSRFGDAYWRRGPEASRGLLRTRGGDRLPADGLPAILLGVSGLRLRVRRGQATNCSRRRPGACPPERSLVIPRPEASRLRARAAAEFRLKTHVILSATVHHSHGGTERHHCKRLFLTLGPSLAPPPSRVPDTTRRPPLSLSARGALRLAPLAPQYLDELGGQRRRSAQHFKTDGM